MYNTDNGYINELIYIKTNCFYNNIIFTNLCTIRNNIIKFGGMNIFF